jgi:uncharacterized ferritin-like protein (DUF455 family)
MIEPVLRPEPFDLAPGDEWGEAPRSIKTLEGVGDRMRAAAFAEVQARDAFLWASENFEDAPLALRRAWAALAVAEQRHLDWLLQRMQELGIDVRARKVSDHLWRSLISCKTAKEFAIYIANAEERGRRAGERFHQTLAERDPITAEIFRKIAEEEISHIALASKYYPDTTITA